MRTERMNKEHKHNQLERNPIGQTMHYQYSPEYVSREQARFLAAPLSCRRIEFLMPCTSRSHQRHDGGTYTREPVRNGFIIVNDGRMVCIQFCGTTAMASDSLVSAPRSFGQRKAGVQLALAARGRAFVGVNY